MICAKCGREIGEGAKFCPYCGEKVIEKMPMVERPIYAADIKSLLKSGKLAVYRDRVEFITSSVQKNIFKFSDFVSVKKGLDRISFMAEDGRTESCIVDRKNIHEAFVYIENAFSPYIAERKKLLLSKGIKYSFFSSMGLNSGMLNILDDRAEFAARSGQNETVFFKNVRMVGLSSIGMLEFSLVDGTSKTFTMDKDIRDEVLLFIDNAIRPYVMERTVGFETIFGIDERIEINEERSVFHIIRQNGKEIRGEYPLGDLVKCEWMECSASSNTLGGVLAGGKAIFNNMARAVGTQGVSEMGEMISYVGVFLSIRTEQGVWTENVRFGDFPLGMGKANKDYEKYIAEMTRFMEYLDGSCPECELVLPESAALPGTESVPALVNAAEVTGEVAVIADGTVAVLDGETEAVKPAETAAEKDQFGIIKYIEGVSGFISECITPMTIAIQGNWGNGKNSVMNMISDSLEEGYGGNMIWFNTWQFAQFDLGEQLPMIVGNRLIGQLNGTNSAAPKDRAIKVAKGLINITTGFISQGSTDGQNFVDALFKDSSTDSLEKLVKSYSEEIKRRIEGKNDKVIIFIDDLDKLSPAKGVELLEAMRSYFDCEGCVFVINVDYNSVISGAKEKYGESIDEKKGKNFFDNIFQISFRVPASGFNIQNYVKDKLEHIEISTDDEEEIAFYEELIKYSVGCEPKTMDRLFNSFLLLKKMADEGTYESRYKRLVLFTLLCMQTKFHDVYDQIVKMREKVTPEFLLEFCSGQSEILDSAELNDDEMAEFRNFVGILHNIINTDQEEGISETECSAFVEVLDISSITSK